MVQSSSQGAQILKEVVIIFPDFPRFSDTLKPQGCSQLFTNVHIRPYPKKNNNSTYFDPFQEKYGIFTKKLKVGKRLFCIFRFRFEGYIL